MLRDKRLESLDFKHSAAEVVLVLLNGLRELLDLELLLGGASLLNQGHMFTFYHAERPILLKKDRTHTT